MAASVQLYSVGSFDAARLTLNQRLQKAIDGQEYHLRRLHGLPHFNIRATTDTNTAVSSSNFAIDLSAQGLREATGALAANETRDIYIDVLASNGANRYRWRQVQRIGLTSSEPVLVGGKQFLTNCIAQYGMTTADGSATTEVALECVRPEWWDGAAPVAGAIASNALTIQWLGTNAPAGSIVPLGCQHHDGGGAAADARSLQFGSNSLTNGTSEIFISDVASPTAATFTNSSAVRAACIITPPMSVDVVINSTPTPDTILVGFAGISSDVVTWDVSITIGDPILLALV